METDIIYLAGEKITDIRPLPPYSDIAVEFLSEFSEALFRDPGCKAYPDIVAVAFWARKGNLLRLKEKHEDKLMRIGRGVAFHITPSNIPVHFALSYMFGLLSGCVNIIKVTTKDYPQIDLICAILNKLLLNDKYAVIRKMTAIVRYPKESEWTEKFSQICNARLIWGGDATVQTIRKLPIPPRAIELTFPDRYSLAIINSDAVLKSDEKTLKRLAQDFYNDTFLVDQNACSSPQLILWQGESVEGKKRFWAAAAEIVNSRYELLPVKVTGKYADFCASAARFTEIGELCSEDNYIYRASLNKIPLQLENLRGKCGLFYEYDISDFNEIVPYINERYQTLTYFGADALKLAKTIKEQHSRGIDRIIPVGKALDMDIVWDGYDIVSELSRIIDVR